MEPPGGLPPDRDRQLVLHSVSQHQQPHQQQQHVPLQKPNFTLNLPQQTLQPSTQHSHAVTSPAPPIVTITALTTSSGSGGSGNSNNNAAHHGATVVHAAATTSTATAAAVPPPTLPALASTATAISATTAAATAFSGSSVAHQHQAPHHQYQQLQSQQQQPHNNSSTSSSSLLGGIAATSTASSIGGAATQPQQTIEKLSRPLAFDKMEALVREMQDPEHGVPVRQQKMFLTSIPYAFMGYDLIEWLMDRLLIEESEALNIANQLCLHGYFFPVNDTKTLVVKDDSSLYRFQTPYYWPWQHKAPDNVEYAIYLAKRSLRNKQRHALEDYEAEALASLHKNLKGKWDFISMQAEEQVRLAKERKKGDKIVGDSQERAYWRVHRPPPGQFTPLEPCPVPSRDRQGTKTNKKKNIEDVQREVDYLKKSLIRTRMKMSQACESLVSYSETFTEYDAFLQPVLPSNPWVTEDVSFWQLNNTFVDVPTEKRVKRWAINIEELVSDPTGLQEFTYFLEKEYSHENIRFWNAVNQLRRTAHSQVARKVTEIFEEFLKPGAPCEINIDGKTMESVLKGLKNPSRFTFDSASEHIYMLLLKKDCYPRFVRSDHFKRLLETGIQPSHKKRFFGFGGVGGAKKKMVATLSNQPNDGTSAGTAKIGGVVGMMQAPPPGSLSRRRGSDRSLTGSAHELAVIGVNKDAQNKVPHSHSQSNLSEIPYSESVYRGDMPTRLLAMDANVYGAYGARDKRLQRATQEPPKPKLAAARLETTIESSGSAVCPWDLPDEPPTLPPPAPIKTAAKVKLSVCPWEQEDEEIAPTIAPIKVGPQRHTSTSSDNSDVSDRLQRSLGIRHQNTVDSGEAAGMKRLLPNFSEQRRASVSFTPSRISEYQVPRTTSSKTTGTPSPTIGGQSVADSAFAPLFTPLANICRNTITKDPPSTSSETELEEELNKLALTEHSAETTTHTDEVAQSKPQQQPLSSKGKTKTTSTSPPITKITPPLESEIGVAAATTATDSQTATSPLTIVTEQDTETETMEEIVPLKTSQIQDVQIELIETNVFIDPTTTATGKSPQRALANTSKIHATPTINVQECPIIAESEELSATNSNSNSPTPKSPKIALEELQAAVDIADLEMYLDATKLSSDKSSAVSLELMAVSCEASPQRPIPSIIPPPLPTVGPMEEEMLQGDDDDDDDVEEDEDIYDEETKCTRTACQEQEELSPTTDEYQEGIQFGADSKDVYDYDIVDTDTQQQGYIAPASTPAPTMAPLAELDVDTVDDEPMDEDEDILVVEQIIRTPPKSPPPPKTTVIQAPIASVAAAVDNVATTEAAGAVVATTVAGSTDEVKKRRKKRYSDGKKITSLDEKDKEKAAATAAGEAKAAADADRNTVCPWEDENVTTSDGTFVKTYATLGYL